MMDTLNALTHDGILVSGAVVSDGSLTTGVGQPPKAPLTSGPRSAYGSVELPRIFSSLPINVSEPNLGGDGGSFPISTVSPTSSATEPGNIALLIGLTPPGAGVVRRRHR
jgi:hypothetical protein